MFVDENCHMAKVSAVSVPLLLRLVCLLVRIMTS